jgi:hypothetical protein
MAAVNVGLQTAAATLPDGVQMPESRQASMELGAEIARLQAELDRAVQLAGLRSDPTWPLIKALSTSLDVQWRLHDQAVRYFHDASERLDTQLADTIAQADKVLETRRTAVVEALVPSLVELTTKNAKAWRRIVSTKTALSFGAFTVVLALGVGMAGYGAGWHAGRVLAVNVSGGLATVARDAGPAAESALEDMMRANNLGQAWARCERTATTAKDGRRVCAMPMWVDPDGPPNGGA